MTERLTDLRALHGYAGRFLETLPVAEGKATLVGLSGDLGSGKTAFVKSVAAHLGIPEEVLSPTFVIAKFYPLVGGRWQRLVHIDAYRIEDPSEASTIGWEELLSDPGNLIFVEWPEQLGVLFPSGAYTLSFRFIDETTREVG